MKKIALNYIYLSKKHAGGKDQVGLNLLKGFYELGYSKEMYVICFDYSVDIIKQLAPDVNIIKIHSYQYRTELARMCKICFVNTFIVPNIVKKYGIALLYHLSCNTGLRKINTKTVVIPHDIKAVSHRVLANVKIPIYKYLFNRILYYIDFRNNDYIIAISDVDKKEISQYYTKFSGKIRRIYNPIDITMEDNSFNRKIGNYITALNLQFHHKNIITLIKAFELIKDVTDVNLVLIGSVPDRVKYLKEYVIEHELQERIVFTGFVSDEEKDRLFKECRLYVNPTLYEGFGMTAVEAMIHRIPTLVSKIDTNVEITKGLCNYYYPPEDEKKLADKIMECLKKEYSVDDLIYVKEQMYKEYNYLTVAERYYEFFTREV